MKMTTLTLGAKMAGVRRRRIERREREDGIVVLTFDRPGSAANVFDEATLLELSKEVRRCEGAAGVVLMSAKKSIFVAGADINSVLCAPTEAEGKRLIRLGQDVFDELAALEVPTVAAVHGACLGGGLEVALACDWRVASKGKATRLGLPETKLGILPAWGGSTRLPRLVGLRKALGMIVGGRPVDVVTARRCGLVDAVVERERLEEAAVRQLARGKRREGRCSSGLVGLVFGWMARRAARRRTRGNYPAVERAIEVVSRSAERTHEESLAAETNAVVELMGGYEAQNLIRLFQMQERAKKQNFGDVKKVKEAVVIGAGVMGAGIAQWLASRGVRVVLNDVDAAALAKGMERVDQLLEGAVKRRVMGWAEARGARDRIVPVAERVPLRRADVVIEAAVEKLNVKRAIFRELENRVGDGTLLATNTSALPLAGLAVGMRHPERLVGLHFFNPVARMPLVEVVAGRMTNVESMARAGAFVQAMGKVPVVVQDSPGFLVNRVLMPYLVEAGRLFDHGVEARLIDEAMLDFGMPMGPLRLIDEVGADVALHVATTLEEEIGGKLVVPGILKEMVANGLLGKKAGSGFYRYGQKGVEGLSRRAEALREKGWMNPGVDAWAVKERLVALMVDEAGACLDEGVARSAEDVDLAMVLGTGFAPFRGGVLRYADEALGRRFYEKHPQPRRERKQR